MIPDNGDYILAYVSPDGSISPEGNGKSYGYAKALLDEYHAKRSMRWQMFRLIKEDSK